MEHIKEILLSRGCPAKQVDTVATKLLNISNPLKQAVSTWLETEDKPNMEVDGFTTNDLMSRFKGMQYPAALLLLDWLIKDPKAAKQAISKGIR